MTYKQLQTYIQQMTKEQRNQQVLIAIEGNIRAPDLVTMADLRKPGEPYSDDYHWDHGDRADTQLILS